ncbi:MAG: hypothetical protein IIB46_07100 [Nitrospinae bacterium]|nr:hypothetical protein [Nitrospinota bacterium]MCH8311417.1 hypothetical protein [Nitrospinota bacterium]
MGKKHERYIVDASGKKTSVVLPIEEYEELIEDLHDLAVMAERKNEENIPSENIKTKLKNSGLI